MIEIVCNKNHIRYNYPRHTYYCVNCGEFLSSPNGAELEQAVERHYGVFIEAHEIVGFTIDVQGLMPHD